MTFGASCENCPPLFLKSLLVEVGNSFNIHKRRYRDKVSCSRRIVLLYRRWMRRSVKRKNTEGGGRGGGKQQHPACATFIYHPRTLCTHMLVFVAWMSFGAHHHPNRYHRASPTWILLIITRGYDGGSDGVMGVAFSWAHSNADIYFIRRERIPVYLFLGSANRLQKKIGGGGEGEGQGYTSVHAYSLPSAMGSEENVAASSRRCEKLLNVQGKKGKTTPFWKGLS